jgi:hypothetical protein
MRFCEEKKLNVNRILSLTIIYLTWHEFNALIVTKCIVNQCYVSYALTSYITYLNVF